MATLLEDLVTYLISKGVVTADGVDVFRDVLPTTPDNVVALIEYDSRVMGKGAGAGRRYIQVSARNASAALAQSKALSAFLALDTEESFTYLTPLRWAQVNVRQSPFRVGTDDLGRVIYAFNLSMITTFE